MAMICVSFFDAGVEATGAQAAREQRDEQVSAALAGAWAAFYAEKHDAALQQAERRAGHQQPTKLAHLGDVRLHKQHGMLGV